MTDSNKSGDSKDYNIIDNNSETIAKNRRKRTALLLNYISILIAVIATLAGSIASFSDIFGKKNDEKEKLMLQRIDSLKISQIDFYLDSLNSKIDKLTIINTDSLNRLGVANIEILNQKQQISDLKAGLENLNKIILDNPEKAISIPLIKQQIDNHKEHYDKEFQYSKDEIARVYDMNKWIIGLVFSMLVSLIVLNISNILAKAKKD